VIQMKNQPSTLSKSFDRIPSVQLLQEQSSTSDRPCAITAKIEMKEMSKKDVEAVYEIEKESFDSPYPREYFAKTINKRGMFSYVAVIDQHIGGYIICWIKGPECRVVSVAVGKKYRGQGIAKFSMNHLFMIAKKHHATHVTLHVSVNNKRAMELYKSFGFQCEQWIDDYYSDSCEHAIYLKASLLP